MRQVLKQAAEAEHGVGVEGAVSIPHVDKPLGGQQDSQWIEVRGLPGRARLQPCHKFVIRHSALAAEVRLLEQGLNRLQQTRAVSGHDFGHAEKS